MHLQFVKASFFVNEYYRVLYLCADYAKIILKLNKNNASVCCRVIGIITLVHLLFIVIDYNIYKRYFR